MDGHDAASIEYRDRVNLDQVAWRQRRHPEHYIRGFVIAKQRFAGFFDDRQASVTFVVDDVDGDPCNLVGPGAGSSTGAAEVEVVRPLK